MHKTKQQQKVQYKTKTKNYKACVFLEMKRKKNLCNLPKYKNALKDI